MLISKPPVEITDSVVMLGTGEYPIYLIRDQGEAAVFEGGVGAMGPVLQQQIERLGIAPDFVKQIIVPHAHPDHVMAVPMFRKIFTCATVSASKAAAGTISVTMGCRCLPLLPRASFDAVAAFCCWGVW